MIAAELAGGPEDLTAGPAAWQARFLTRVAALADVSGLPPSYIHVFAWLVVCAHQPQYSFPDAPPIDLRGGR